MPDIVWGQVDGGLGLASVKDLWLGPGIQCGAAPVVAVCAGGVLGRVLQVQRACGWGGVNVVVVKWR